MKNLGIIGIAALGLALTSCSGTEEQTVEKKIEITDDNGDTKVEITTTEDDVTTTESYTGDAAKEKVKEVKKEVDTPTKTGDVKTIVESVKTTTTTKKKGAEEVVKPSGEVEVNETVKPGKGKGQ